MQNFGRIKRMYYGNGENSRITQDSPYTKVVVVNFPTEFLKCPESVPTVFIYPDQPK